MCGVSEHDFEASKMKRLWLNRDYCVMEKTNQNNRFNSFLSLYLMLLFSQHSD